MTGVRRDSSDDNNIPTSISTHGSQPLKIPSFGSFSVSSQIDEANVFGNTALHMACHMGHDAVATELVNCGANINQPNLHGSTPLHLAAASSSGVLCLELLINNGADVSVQVSSLF